MLQPGTLVQASWKGRLEEHLGNYSFELLKPYAALVMDDSLRLAAVSSVCALIETGFPERDPHQQVYETVKALLDSLIAPAPPTGLSMSLTPSATDSLSSPPLRSADLRGWA